MSPWFDSCLQARCRWNNGVFPLALYTRYSHTRQIACWNPTDSVHISKGLKTKVDNISHYMIAEIDIQRVSFLKSRTSWGIFLKCYQCVNRADLNKSALSFWDKEEKGWIYWTSNLIPHRRYHCVDNPNTLNGSKTDHFMLSNTIKLNWQSKLVLLRHRLSVSLEERPQAGSAGTLT